MVGWILKKILGSKNQREVKRMAPLVRRINEFEQKFQSCSDEQLRSMTASWQDEFSKLENVEDHEPPGAVASEHGRRPMDLE